MPKFDLRDFNGLAPKRDARVQNTTYATKAVDVKLWDGTLRNFPCPTVTCTKPEGVKSFVFPNRCQCQTSTVRVDVVQSCSMAFFTGEDTNPKMAVMEKGCLGEVTPWEMKCPDLPPQVQSNCNDEEGTRLVSYKYTRVFRIGTFTYESAPSHATDLVPMCGSTVVSFAVTNEPHFTGYRLYRSESGFKTGEESKTIMNTGWFKVAETNKTSYEDVGGVRGLTPEPPFLHEYGSPPIDMFSLAQTESGVMVGLVGDKLMYTLPGQPMTWSYKRAHVIHHTWGKPLHVVTHRDTVYVFTDNRLVMFDVSLSESGVHLRRSVTEKPAALASIGSVATSHMGVLFATDYGYLIARGTQLTNLSSAWFNNDQWRELDPSSVVGSVYGDALVFATRVDAFMLEFGDDVFSGENIGTLISLNLKDSIVGATAMTTSRKGVMWAKGGKVYDWNWYDYPTRHHHEEEVVPDPCCPFVYETLIQDANSAVTFTAAEVHVDIPTETGAITMSVFERDISKTKLIRVKKIENTKDHRQFRLKGWRRGEDALIRLEGCGVVDSATLATSMTALRGDQNL